MSILKKPTCLLGEDSNPDMQSWKKFLEICGPCDELATDAARQCLCTQKKMIITYFQYDQIIISENPKGCWTDW